MHVFRRFATGAIVPLILLGAATTAVAQNPPASGQHTSPIQNGAAPPLDDTIDAAEEGGEEPPNDSTFNKYDGKHFSIRVGGGFLFDYANYAQDDASAEQFDLKGEGKVRDARVLFKGQLKFLGKTTWSAGIMYDYANEEWVFRQTGIMFPLPKALGDIFIGRTKEGVSLNKVMVGYSGWTMERAPINDATIPILADGVKWLGYAPKAHLLWNVGVYGDALSEGQGFSTYHHQVAGRLGWLPLLSPDGGTLLHLGVSVRYGTPKDDSLRLRARPGASPAPYFVDTGSFAASSATLTGLEAYYRPGPLLIGSEFIFQSVDAPASGNPFFHGGEVFVSWLLTGETRTYNVKGGYFNSVSPSRPVFRGGPGAWEVVGQWTYIDLDSGSLTGGRYWRVTPMVNWHVSNYARLEFAYGYGSLDRFGITGATQFFQTRLQLTL